MSYEGRILGLDIKKWGKGTTNVHEGSQKITKDSPSKFSLSLALSHSGKERVL
jgi:hypothetical protein